MRSSGRHNSSPTRILALDLHPRKFGYVVMESPGQLLDWGVCRSYRKAEEHAQVLVRRRLRPLLRMWAPDAVLTRIDERKRKQLQAILKRVRGEVGGGTSFLPIKNPPRHFPGRNKYERAREIAVRLPEIGWKLPAQPTLWQSEHYSLSIFEAARMALLYLQ